MRFETVRKPVVAPIDHVKIELSIEECNILFNMLHSIPLPGTIIDTSGYYATHFIITTEGRDFLNRLKQNLETI